MISQKTNQTSESSVILHVLVVGFHHKHGSQIEYCFPPIAGSSRCPEAEPSFPKQWVDIASLAIPDGAHNTDSDVIYFVLPSLEVRNRTVYAISCYRQIPVDDEFRQKNEELTRSTVQKSVCVLSTVPLYGVLKSKLQLITEAYFNEKDFSKVDVLNQMYNNLCDLFNEDYLDAQTIYSGISLLPLLKTFKHRALVLFKLLLLEKKVIFKVFPVVTLGDILVGLVSLFPGLLDKGLSESASYSALGAHCKRFASLSDDTPIDLRYLSNSLEISVQDSPTQKIDGNETLVQLASEYDKPDDLRAFPNINPLSFDTDGHGFPLSIFTKGSVFHPYLNISSIDMLRSDSVRAFCVGVTNSLFTQKPELVDVIVTVDEKGDGQVDILSADLKRQLVLTKQDLRFMDFLLKMIEINDNTIWEGSDDWVRLQFCNYLTAMLATALAVSKSIDQKNTVKSSSNKDDLTPSDASAFAQEFNFEFILELYSKHNYRVWSSVEHLSFSTVSLRHPFAGQSSVNDVILRVNHAMNDSEQGRRVLNAFSNTGKLVAETKSRFKSSLASWWSRDDNATPAPAINISNPVSSATIEKAKEITEDFNEI